MSSVLEAETQPRSKKRQREQQADHASRKARKIEPAEQSDNSEPTERRTAVPKKFEGHTKKERKHNRSTRIHSLRKLLTRSTLPSTIRQEKERELAALLHEQNANRSRKEDKKVLEKYHYVRFIERQKAEKRLKQLRKKQREQTGDDGDDDIEGKIHEMEVNRNYAIYSPLNQKYVSIFAEGQQRDDEPGHQAHKRGRNKRQKPPLWYKVEEAMSVGEVELDALRDGRSALLRDELSEHTSAGDGTQLRLPAQQSPINNVSSRQQKSLSATNGDEDDSDDDFFER